MTLPVAVILAMLALLLILAATMVIALHRLRTESGAALRGLQLQIAFIAGRIGLTNRDLEAQIPLTKEPEGQTDAEGFSEWKEAEWMIGQAEEAAAASEAGGER